MKKVDRISFKIGYVITAIGLVTTAVSFFISDTNRNALFICGAITLVVGIAMVLSIKPVKKL